MMVLLLTICIALLNVNSSRLFNYQLALVELLVIFSALAIYKKQFLSSFPVRSESFLLVLSLIFILFLSSALSEHVKHGFERSVAITIWLIYFWMVVFLLRYRYLKPVWLVWAIALSCLLPMLLLIVRYIELEPVSYWQFTTRHLESYSHIRHIGYHAIAALFFSLGFILVRRHKMRWSIFLLGFLLVIVNLSFMIWSGSRQGVLLFSLFGIALLLFYYRKSLYLAVPLLLLVISASLGLIYLLNIDAGISVMLKKTLASSDLNRLLSGRVDIWKISWGFLDNHFLLGLGPDYFINTEFAIKRRLVQPHSVVIQSLLEIGIVGSLLLLALFSVVLKKAWASIKTISPDSPYYPHSLVAFTLILAYLLNSSIDGVFYHALPVYMFCMALALLVYRDTADYSE